MDFAERAEFGAKAEPIAGRQKSCGCPSQRPPISGHHGRSQAKTSLRPLFKCAEPPLFPY
jgi:hypothetical protein